MKKILPVLIVILILILLIIITLSIPSVRNKLFGVKLEYKFVQGGTSVYKTNTDIGISFDSGMARALRVKDIVVTLESDSTREVSNVKGNQATIVFIDTIKGANFSVEGKTVSPDIPVGLETKTIIETAQNGRILNIESAKRDVDIDKIRSRFTFFRGWIVFPDKAIKPGHTWKDKIDVDLEVKYFKTRLKGDVEYKFERFETYRGTKCALITFTGKYNTEATVGKKNKVIFNAVNNLKGKLHFDIEGGEALLLYREIDLNMTKQVPFLNVKISLDGKYKIVTEKIE